MSQIELLKSLLNSENNLEQVVRDFTETRDNLIKLFIKYNSEDNISDSNCPVCGYEWPNGYDELMKNIEGKGEEIKNLQSNNSIELDRQYDLIYRFSIEPLLNFVDSYLSNNSNLIDERYINKLYLDNESHNEVIFLLDWLKNKSIDISQNCLSDLSNIPDDINLNILNISSILQSQKVVVEDSFDSLKFSIFFEKFY